MDLKYSVLTFEIGTMQDIDLCGLYAGEPAIYNAGGLCQGLCTDLIHDPNNFNTAYFEIEFLRVFVECVYFLLPTSYLLRLSPFAPY